MKIYREENIQALAEAIMGDQYNELSQIDAVGDEPKEVVDFINRNIEGVTDNQKILEIIKRKQDSRLEEMSLEELEKMIK